MKRDGFIYKRKILGNNQEIHFLFFNDFEFSNYLSYLTEIEKEKLFSFKSIDRKKQFTATRILRHDLFGFEHIHYNSVGAPYIQKEGFLSISHIKNCVAITFNKEFPVGLDLEIISDKAQRLYTKFLSVEEISQLETTSIKEMTVAWSLKEVLYKLSQRKKIIFKEQLILKKVTEESWIGQIITSEKKMEVNLHNFVIDDIVVSINISAAQDQYDGIG
jgi:4'-phosphopantetheinyl transferase EntD